jgi:DNA-binding MarR family transcriptional regulator
MAISELARALAIFNSLSPSAFPLHHAQVLVFIAQKGSCSYAEIETAFNLSNASVSRICGALSDASNRRVSTLNLIEIFRDPNEGRRHRVRLNAKGKAVMQTVAQALEPTTQTDQWKPQAQSLAGPPAGL